MAKVAPMCHGAGKKQKQPPRFPGGFPPKRQSSGCQDNAVLACVLREEGSYPAPLASIYFRATPPTLKVRPVRRGARPVRKERADDGAE